MRKYHFVLNIWFLFCLIVSPVLFWEIIFGSIFDSRRFFNNDASNIIPFVIFTSAYLIFPVFFVYQMILMLKKQLKKVCFWLSVAGFLIFLLNILFYIWFYHLLDEMSERKYTSNKTNLYHIKNI